MTNKLNTKVEIVEIDEEAHYGKFVMSPLERGYGTTIGNSLRRVLLSSLPGAAFSSIKFDEGVHHEFSTVEGVVEDVPEIILNIKGIAIKKLNDESQPVRLRIDVKGPAIITADDISKDTDIEIVDPDHYICTINSDAHFRMDLVAISGRGYVVSDQNKHEDDPIDTIAIDSSFTPVTKVNFTVNNTRKGEITDYDSLELEVWTNGTITPQEATAEGANILIDLLKLVTELPSYVIEDEEDVEEEEDTEKQLYSMAIEDLDLSLRSFNCLKRANINTVGDILSRGAIELQKIRNFGKKSFGEVEEKIHDLGLELTEEPLE